MGIHFKEKQPRAYLEHTLQRHLDAAEALIAELDEMDGDPELEPLLGSVGGYTAYADQAHWAQGATDDREEQCEGEAEACEGEGDWDELEPEEAGRPLTYHPDDQRRVLSARFGDHVIYTDV